MTPPARPHVVIVGGGFGGLTVARGLGRAPVDVTVVDRRNFHLFQPLLYQVATGGLSPGDIATPLRYVLRRQKNTRVLLGEVVDLDPEARRLKLRDGEVAYDVLILAPGSHPHYFAHPEWQPIAPGLKTIEDATRIRSRIFLAFEHAERECDPAARAAWLTFVVVGGGPTGVELAGALAEIAHHTLRHDFRAIDPGTARIIIVEAAERVLAPYPPGLSARALTTLSHLQIDVRTGSLVVAVDPDGVVVERWGPNGAPSGAPVAPPERIPARTVIWAAGVQASPLGKVVAERTGATLDRGGRVTVGPDLAIPGHPAIFVIGDLALVKDRDAKPLPGVAPVAMQEARYVARQIRAELDGAAARAPFHYRDPGQLAVIGRGSAVADFGRLKLSGYPAWLQWLFIHLMNLVEFEDRLLVLVQWAWNYLTWNRGARLIANTEPTEGEQRKTA
jgi:NADH dehydrogenase